MVRHEQHAGSAAAARSTSSRPSARIRRASTARTHTYDTAAQEARSAATCRARSRCAISPNRSASCSTRVSGDPRAIAGFDITITRPDRLTPPDRARLFFARSLAIELKATSRCHSNSPRDAQKKIAALCERYPVAGSKQPVVIAALHLAQKDFGHLSDDALRLVARTLDLPYAHVYGVATFYTMYPARAGRHARRSAMCTNISCMLRGGYDVLAAFEKQARPQEGRVQQGVLARRGGVHRGVRERAVRGRRHEVLPRHHAGHGRRHHRRAPARTPHPESEVV